MLFKQYDKAFCKRSVEWGADDVQNKDVENRGLYKCSASARSVYGNETKDHFQLSSIIGQFLTFVA